MDNKKRSTLSWSASLAVHATGAVMILVAGFHIATPSGTVTDKTEFTAVEVAPVGAPAPAAPAAPAAPVSEAKPPTEAPPAEVAKPAEAPPPPPDQEPAQANNDSEAEEAPKPFTPTEADDSAQDAAADPAQEPGSSPVDSPPPSESPTNTDTTAAATTPATAAVMAPATAQTPSASPEASPSGPLIDETKLMEAFGNHKPEYPWMARLRRQQGTVILRAFVDKDGGVSQVTIEKSSGSQLIDEEAQRTYGRWRYQPGLSGQVLKPFKFSLK